jgi:hypothetical protein
MNSSGSVHLREPQKDQRAERSLGRGHERSCCLPELRAAPSPLRAPKGTARKNGAWVAGHERGCCLRELRAAPSPLRVPTLCGHLKERPAERSFGLRPRARMLPRELRAAPSPLRAPKGTVRKNGAWLAATRGAVPLRIEAATAPFPGWRLSPEGVTLCPKRVSKVHKESYVARANSLTLKA